MKCRYIALAYLMIIYSISHATNEDYYGSQAFNKTQLEHISVNAATGTLEFSYPLINTQGRLSRLQVNLSYRYNHKGMFGLPNGWQIDLDYINNKSVHLHGQQWLIDPLWHDETGFTSGLKYYNQHGTQFIDEGITQSIPNNKNLFYRYLAMHKDGSKKYFSEQGLLILQSDRFNNTVSYEYQEPVDTLSSAKIHRIIDNYGNIYTFSYAPNEIILRYPDEQTAHIYFNDSGVIDIVNRLNRNTFIQYVQEGAKTLLRSIETASGLLTRLTYNKINYKDDTSIKTMPVVTQFTQLDKQTNNILRDIHYSYSSDANFTGYPLYDLSENGDSLMESNNQSYRYSVEVSQSDLNPISPKIKKQVFFYNYLHLPIEIHTLNEGNNYQKINYEYDISAFKYGRSTNYDKPVSVTKYIWDEDQNNYLPTDRTKTTYDKFGNKTEDDHIIFDRYYHRWTAVSSQKNRFFTDHYSLLSSSIQIDHITGKQIKTEYTLSTDGKTHAESTKEYINTEEEAWKPWKKSMYNHDNFGRRIENNIEWSINKKSGIDKTSLKITYHFDPITKYLTRKTESALGSVKTDIFDTSRNIKLTTVSPMNEMWQYNYDVIGRHTETIDPEGKKTTIHYLDYQTDSINSVISTSPLGHQKRKDFDAINQVIHEKDLHKKQWRTLNSYQYDGFGKIIEKSDILGLKTFYQYDIQNRLTQSNDPWENTKTIQYNDIELITSVYLNQHKIHETLYQPWKATVSQRQYPVFENSYDPQVYYIEDIIQKNGLNETIKTTSSLVHRFTLEESERIITEFNYDASHNLVEQKVKGFDGTSYWKLNDYDLLNNKMRSVKKTVTHNKISERESEMLHFNEDNLLVEITSPLLSNGSRQVTRFEYDKNGNKIKSIQPNQQEILFNYNSLGLLTERRWHRNNALYIQKHHYDADRRITETSDSEGQSIQYTYTPNGLIEKITYPDNRAMDYTYDDKDRIKSLFDYNSIQQMYHYNEEDRGKLSSIEQGHNLISFHYGIDSNGLNGQLLERLSSLEKEGDFSTVYGYGAMNQVVKMKTTNQNKQILYDVAYQFKPRGELIFQSVQSHSNKSKIHHVEKIYRYDSLNRLIGEQYEVNDQITNISYQYDANNNITQENIQKNNCIDRITQYTYNELDQLILSSNSHKVSDDSYEYNTNGHLIRDGHGNQYHYDDNGFMLKVSMVKGPISEYQYLPNGLLGKKTNNKLNQYFYYDHHHKMITEMTNDQSLSLIRFGKSIIAGITDNGVDQLFTAQQSTGAIITSDSGLETYTYQGYGKQLHKPSNKSIAAYSWNQEYNDPDTHLTYLKNRFYLPEIKRFMSKDSFAADNRYAFPKANPIRYIDPMGHNAQQAINYGIGSASIGLGIAGILFAIPTAGASLSLSAGAAITSGATLTLSGISQMGSQGALDSGNKDAAKALQYTSIGFGVASVISGGVALTAKLSTSMTPLASSSQIFSRGPRYGATMTESMDINIEPVDMTSSAENSLARSDSSLTQPQSIPEILNKNIDMPVPSPSESEPSIYSLNSSSSSESLVSQFNTAVNQSAIKSITSSESGSISSSSSSFPRYQVYVKTPLPAQNFGPAPPWFVGGDSMSFNVTDTATSVDTLIYEDMSGTNLLEGVDRSMMHHSLP